ncbi:MAG TPA: ATP synthase F1 subunit epsilon [Paracoccaceae bacterium]|nr:ATP synthase F1 subunit epsilon [Paracoccaceae bacterium]
MQFELVSPERRLAAMEASAVTIPGIAGDLTAMPNHAPFLTTLRPGLLVVTASGGTTEYFVSGGFAEISPEAVSILAEEAVERAAVTPELLERLTREAQEALEIAGEDTRAAAAIRVNDFIQLASRLPG